MEECLEFKHHLEQLQELLNNLQPVAHCSIQEMPTWLSQLGGIQFSFGQEREQMNMNRHSGTNYFKIQLLQLAIRWQSRKDKRLINSGKLLEAKLSTATLRKLVFHKDLNLDFSMHQMHKDISMLRKYSTLVKKT